MHLGGGGVSWSKIRSLVFLFWNCSITTCGFKHANIDTPVHVVAGVGIIYFSSALYFVIVELDDGRTDSGINKKSSSNKILLILGVNLGILVLAGCVGITCYKKRSNLQFYYKLPGMSQTAAHHCLHLILLSGQNLPSVMQQNLMTKPIKQLTLFIYN